MTIDAGFARWLREGVRFAPATDAAIVALWGTIARTLDIVSCLATEDGAEDEAARQIAFMGAAIVIDDHVVDGLRHDLVGLPVTIKNDRLGYSAGVSVFVIGVAEAEQVSQTTLTVLRKLT